MKTLKISLLGLALWGVGTIGLRLGGDRLLHPDKIWSTLTLYQLSFVLMAQLARRIFSGLGLAKEQWVKAAGFLMLPTLLLDPFSCVFFSEVFPNVDPAAAGEFGGWMLICCGGVLGGALSKR